MSITLSANTITGVCVVTDYEMDKQGGVHYKAEYFYDALPTLKDDDGTIYANFDNDSPILQHIKDEYGIH